MSERIGTLSIGPTDVAAMPREALPLLLVELAARQSDLAALQTAVAARLVATASPAPATTATTCPTTEPTPEYIDPETAAALVNVSRRVIYGWSRRKDWQAFCHRPSRKVLRIERAAYLAWWNRLEGPRASMVSCHSVTERAKGYAKAEPEGRATNKGGCSRTAGGPSSRRDEAVACAPGD